MEFDLEPWTPTHSFQHRIGDVISFKEFAYHNKLGGTGFANNTFHGQYDSPGIGVCTGKITKFFWDYETGWVIHVKLNENSFALIKDKAKENKAMLHDCNILRGC